MIEFEFLARKSESTHAHSDIELFYIVEGSAVFTLEDKRYTLKKDGFLVVNVDKNHSYEGDEDF